MEKTLLSIGLGCQTKYAKDFVYADSLNLNDKKTETPIGDNCRTCDRMDCQQRAFPPLHIKFDITYFEEIFLFVHILLKEQL